MKHTLHSTYTALLCGALLLSAACSGPEQDPPDMTQAEADMPQAVDDMTTVPEDMGMGEEDMSDPPEDMSSQDEDMSAPDADLGQDQGTPDMPAEEDMSSRDEDMSAAMLPLDGFGVLTGDCDVIDDEITSQDSFIFENSIDFGMDPYDDMDLMKLSEGGQTMIEKGNAGGSSLYSEVCAYEVLYRCEEAVLLKTETEIQYEGASGKITDLLVEIDGQKVGVSVVRAFAFPFEDPYPIEEAERILDDKLSDIQLSSARVKEEDRWVKQILSVIAYTEQHAMQIRMAYDQLDASVKSDTILVVTVTEGEDRPLYFND